MFFFLFYNYCKQTLNNVFPWPPRKSLCLTSNNPLLTNKKTLKKLSCVI